MGPLIVLILLFFVMYTVMIRPQQKRAREHQALIAAVEIGDDVMTTAGIFGTVTSIEGDVIGIEIAPGVQMRVARAAIGRRMSEEPEELDAGDDLDDIDDVVAPDDVINVDEIASGTSSETSTPEPGPTAVPPATPDPGPTPGPTSGPPSAPGADPQRPGNGDVPRPGEPS